MTIRTKYGIEIDDTKKAGECLANGCPNKANPDPCCFCAEHHPHHDPQRAKDLTSGRDSAV